MKAYLLIILTAISVVAFGQRTKVDKILNKYDWNQGLTLKTIDPGSTEFSSELKIEGEAFEKAIASIDQVNIVKGDSASASPEVRNAFYKAVFEAIGDKSYTTLLDVHSNDGENVGLYANKNKNEHISEFIFLVNEKNSLMMFQVKGDIDMSTFSVGEVVQALSGGHDHKDCKEGHNSGD